MASQDQDYPNEVLKPFFAFPSPNIWTLSASNTLGFQNGSNEISVTVPDRSQITTISARCAQQSIDGAGNPISQVIIVAEVLLDTQIIAKTQIQGDDVVNFAVPRTYHVSELPYPMIASKNQLVRFKITHSGFVGIVGSAVEVWSLFVAGNFIGA